MSGLAHLWLAALMATVLFVPSLSAAAALPEDRNWRAFIQEVQTNTDMKLRGVEAVRILDVRIEALVAEMAAAYDEHARALLRHNHEAWRAAAGSKAAFLSDTYRGGIHLGLAHAYAMIEAQVQRIAELKAMHVYRTEP